MSYTIKPKSGLTTGTPIRNVALITFDFNPSIATDQVDPHDPSAGIDEAKQALVTIDAGSPTSSITPLAALENSSFTVKWTATDDAGGSGPGAYNVYVSHNGEPFTLWQSAIPETSARFTGA